MPRPPRRPGREGPGHRVQLRERGDAPRRPGAVRRARRRGDPAGHPPRRGRQPHRPDRRDLHPGHRRVDGLRGRVRGRHPRRADGPGLPEVRRLRRGRRHLGRRAARPRPRVPRPADRGGRRHPGARLHPLPVAHRGHLLRDGRRRDAGQQRGGVRQGGLQDAGEHRPDPSEWRPDVLLPHHGCTRRLRDHRQALPRPRDGGRLPVRGRARHEADHRRLLGLVPRPRLARELLPPGGRRRRRPHLAGAPRPR